jgi:hypothetical protein
MERYIPGERDFMEQSDNSIWRINTHLDKSDSHQHIKIPRFPRCLVGLITLLFLTLMAEYSLVALEKQDS